MKKETIRNQFIRSSALTKLKETKDPWDVLVIGGGATGLGVALDASARGLKTLLIEQADFANGTSSRSTKLAHGGVRYLAQGNISLVFEALKERGLMIKNAPHLVNMLPFIIPSYKWWEKYFYGIGLKIYDWMAKSHRLQKTKMLHSETVKNLLPNLKKAKLNGGILYFDGQFDDTRLALNIAQTAVEKGGVLINYMKALDLIKNKEGKITGAIMIDVESGKEFEIRSKIVVNATGVFVDNILKMNAPLKNPLVKASQGIHIVLDSSFMDSEKALMIPATSDGRVLFAVPWHDHLLVGTTDTPLDEHLLEPVALEQEIDFILGTLEEYLEKKPTRKDILSVFAGLRPLVQPNKEKGTKEISRDHKLIISNTKLITITGGKWTTYRKMAEDAVNAVLEVGNFGNISCKTKDLKIHGYSTLRKRNYFDLYGSDAQHIEKMANETPALGEKLHPRFPNIKAEVIWATKNEMARNIEDVLARRLRILFLDAKAAIDIAPLTASLMANELGRDKDWESAQVEKFTVLAQNYLPEKYFPKSFKSNKTKVKKNTTV